MKIHECNYLFAKGCNAVVTQPTGFDMKNTPTKTFQRFIPVFAACALAQLAGAQIVWTGASGTDLNWSTPGNWSPSGPPGASDDAQFLDAGATNDAVSINNVLSTDATVQSIYIGPTNGSTTTPEAFNTLIDPGVVLTVTGANTTPAAYQVGTLAYVAVNTTVTNTVTGQGGALVLDNTNNQLIVREGNGSSGAHMATLDLSGLDTFSANLNSIQVGVGDSSYRRAVGTMLLARTNTITVIGSEGAPGIFVGDNSGNNNGNGSISYFELGQQNDMNTDYIRVGGQKQQGQMFFNPALASPTLRLRGSGGGTNRVAYIGIGDEHHQSSSGNPTTGRLDLSGGTADILADTIYVGRSQSGSGSGAATGFLTLGAGTLDVNTLEVAYQNASSVGAAVNGTITVGSNGLSSAGATLIINSNFDMGYSAGAAKPINPTLNVNGGTVNVRGAFSSAGNASVSVTGGLLNLPPHSSLLANSVTVSGGLITNVDVLQASNSLTISGGIIANPLVFDMGGSGLANWDVTGTPSGGLVVSNEFSGAGNFYGNLTMAPGSVLIPGGAGGVNALFLYNNLALNGATLRVDLSNSGYGVNDSIYAYGSLTLGATNEVRISALNGALDTVNPYTLINYYGALTGDQTDFQIAGAIAQSRYTFTFSTNTPNAIQLLVGGAGAANLLWAGDGLTNSWDLKTTTNWNNGGNPDKFYNLDSVTFDDTGSVSPAVNLAEVLVPGAIVMSNNVKAYVFAGTGALAGGSLTNYGAGGLTIENQATNDFNVVDVENGNVTFAGNCANNLAGGLLVNNFSGIGTVSATLANTNANNFGASGVVLNNGVLIFDQAADAEMSAAISGYGTVIKTNTNTLTLSGNNTGLSAPIIVSGGTLKVGAASAVENNDAGVFVTNGGALDVNGQILNAATIAVTASGSGPDGTGAIVNSGADQVNAFGMVTLAGDTTFGGTGRWDIRSGSATLSVNGLGYNITKVGTNEVALVSAHVDSTLGDIDVQQGEFAIQQNTVANGGVGDPTKTITVHSGALLETYNLGAANPLNKNIVLQDGAAIQNDNNASVIGGAVTLQGAAVFNVNAPYTFANVIGGSGSLTKMGGSTLIVSAANTYAGATVVSNGTLQVDGSIGGSGVDVAGGTLAGVGSVTAPVTIETNGVLAPGDNAIGALSVANTLLLAGTNRMDVDDTGGVLTSDVITNVTTLTLGGTLQLNVTGDTALAAGDSISLYSAGSITGSFANIVPATPGAGLQWDTSELASQGVLKVVAAQAGVPTITGIGLSGTTLSLTATNGVANSQFVLLGSTNVALPLNQWTPLLTNTFDGSGNLNLQTNIVNFALPQEFYILSQ